MPRCPLSTALCSGASLPAFMGAKPAETAPSSTPGALRTRWRRPRGVNVRAAQQVSEIRTFTLHFTRVQPSRSQLPQLAHCNASLPASLTTPAHPPRILLHSHSNRIMTRTSSRQRRSGHRPLRMHSTTARRGLHRPTCRTNRAATSHLCSSSRRCR